MNCSYFDNGRCTVASALAREELGIDLQCLTTPGTCERCQKKGDPCPEKPSSACLGIVTKEAPREHLQQWSAFCSWIVNGKSRGLGDTIAKVTRATGIDRVVKAAARAVGASGCGCGGRQKKLNQVAPYSVVEPSVDGIQP